MRYYGNVYRPPSEAYSLIIQATVGCSNNNCTFCEMYKDEQFRIRKLEDVLADLKEMSEIYPDIKRIFIADGDALVLSIEYWATMLDYINENFKNIERISSYATAADINRKSDNDLALLRSKGLEMLYIGFESGDDQILLDVNKKMTRTDYIEAMKKAHKAGFVTSATVIAGLGGREKWKQNALNTASLITETKPNYLSYLTINLAQGTALYSDYISGKFEMPSPDEILYEIREFIENVDSQGTIFRSNHASNYLILKGNLNEDKDMLMDTIDQALKDRNFRPEAYRGF